jgi:cation:H+ antiporter
LVFLVWLKFVCCLVIILVAGTKAARYGDIIAEKTGLGRIWIGLILLAVITSMPELITGVSSTALVGIPDLGLGTLLGSCIFNLSILAVLDVLHRSGPVLNGASLKHLAPAGIGILLIAIAAGGIAAGDRFPGLALGSVGIPSIIIFVVYVLGMWRLSPSQGSHQAASIPDLPALYQESSLKSIWPRFALAAAAIIGSGIWLSYIGDEIAMVTHWDESFIGSLLLAITTSMPELVVAIAALRLGAIDMALADILGANMLDISYTFILDLFYTKGSLLASVSPAHLITAVVLTLMTIVVILGLRFRQRRKTFYFISWYGLLLVGLYIYGAYALFTSSIGAG